MSASAGYILDTNVVLALMRMNPLGTYIEKTFSLQSSLNRSMISVVTVGEMLSLGRQFGWGDRKFNVLEEKLSQLVWIDVSDPEILESYGIIDHESQKKGRRMGKNDVWIAASAHVSGATLLTTDRDFDHLHPVWINRVWIDPSAGKSP